MHSNHEILGSVLARWMEPISSGLMLDRMVTELPAVKALENKVRSTGWVSHNWSIADELKPLIGGMSSSFIAPFITGLLSGLPDDSLPSMAHGIVDRAIEMGSLTILEGKITFDAEDLKTLKKLLDYNLPMTEDTYIVREHTDC